MNPIDLLPIKEPLTDPSPPSEVDFYNNVARHLIKDIIKIELNGIPISLNKVKELEETIVKVLNDITTTLKNNALCKRFLKATAYRGPKDVIQKSSVDFFRPFVHKNKRHFSYVINYYLIRSARDKAYIQPEWNKKDLRQLCQIYETSFLRNMLNPENLTASEYLNIIIPAMQELAQIRANIYNRNRKEIEKKKEQKALAKSFNPGSSVQKAALFKFIGIESEQHTNKGQDQWDRKELEKLNAQLTILLKEDEKQ